MFARVSAYQLRPGTADQFTQAAEQLRGKLDMAPGFQRAYALVDRQANKGMTIAVFDTRQNAEGFAQTGPRNSFMDAVGSLVEGSINPAIYEVTVEL